MKKENAVRLSLCLMTACMVVCAMITTGCDTTGTVTEISYSELRDIVYDSEALAGVALIDVRPAAAFASGCIQNARNIDLEDLLDQYGSLIDEGAALTAIVPDKSTPIITYCDGYGKAQQFANAAAGLGYNNVRSYSDGLADWRDTQGDYLVIAYSAFKDWHDEKFPFEDETDYLISANLESWYTGAEVQEGHIPGAVSLPSPELATRDDSGALSVVDDGAALSAIVADTTAKVIVYCGSFTCGRSLDVAQAAVSLGYTNVYRYQGGYNEWKDEGNDIAEGSAPY